MVEPDRPKMRAVIWLTVFVCWVPKAVDTHSEYVIVFGFPGR
jgi:hypothetical protein